MKKGGGGGLPHFFITLYFNYILGKVHMCLRKVKFLLFRFNIQSFELIIQHSHPSLYSTKTFYHWYISDRYG